MKILITGVAGFIGMAVAKKILENNSQVIGIDNLNNYYDINLKKARLENLKKYKNFKFIKKDILSKDIDIIFKKYRPEKVIHLAAQPGVRYSIINPKISTRININGFLNIIEIAKNYDVKHFIYASSSSVYGSNNNTPYTESQKIDAPKSIYAATKKSNELFANTYSEIFKIRTTGLRYFTVYGPWGRPDMAAMTFISKILNNEYIDVYNNGKMKRDFTYIDDIANGTFQILKKNLTKKYPLSNVFNLGNSSPIMLLNFIKLIEKHLNKKAKLKFLPLQLGDLKSTHSNILKAKKYFNYSPKTPIDIGLKKLIKWYLDYY